MQIGTSGMPAHHGAAENGVVAVVLLAPFVLALVLYVTAVAITRRRGRPWPGYRSLFWIAGVAIAAGAFAGPTAEGFTGHMAQHLLLGMVAPLLLVRAAPATLALRTLGVVPARRVSRMLNSPPARVLTNPVVAAAINIGSLWLLYRTPLLTLMMTDPVVHAFVLVHFLAAGYLFTASLVPVDPAPHRSSFALRATVLVLSIAAHGILAKSLVATPPVGIPAAEAEAGARLMFTGGDAVELVVAALLCAQAYRAAGRRLARERDAPPTPPREAGRARLLPTRRWSPS